MTRERAAGSGGYAMGKMGYYNTTVPLCVAQYNIVWPALRFCNFDPYPPNVTMLRLLNSAAIFDDPCTRTQLAILPLIITDPLLFLFIPSPLRPGADRPGKSCTFCCIWTEGGWPDTRILRSANFSLKGCVNHASRLSPTAGSSFTQPFGEKLALRRRWTQTDGRRSKIGGEGRSSKYHSSLRPKPNRIGE